MRLRILVALALLPLLGCPESSEKKSDVDAASAASTATTAATPPPPPPTARTKASCVDSSQCPGGGCEYLPGCTPITGYCGPAVHSCLVSRPYCGCDGVTFNSCPPPHHSFSREGPCESPRDK